MNRRTFNRLLGAGAVTAAATATTACGGSSSGSSDGAVRYAWWGDAVRQKNYEAALAVFSKENPDVTVRPEFADYTAFQERITVQMAGRNVPELFWIPSPQVLTYEAAGLYRTLDDLEDFDLSDYPPELLETFKLGGQLNTMPRSVFTPCVRWNQTFLEEAGAELPAYDEASWTWDALAEFLIDYSADNPQGRKGAAYCANGDMVFESWVRQHGGDLWTEEGTLGFEPEVLEGWFAWWENLRAKGATLELSEQEGADGEWSLIGEKALLTLQNSNHIVDEAQQFPDYDFQQRMTPANADATPGFRFGYLSRIAMYARTAEGSLPGAAKLLNFNLNDARMVSQTGLTVGAPANPRILAEIRPDATPDEIKLLDLVDEEMKLEQRPRYEAPPGSGTWRDVMARTIEAVTLGSTSIPDASAAFISEVSREIDAAKK
ncbi:ABC transporter substrate-binding protein [Kineococcus radiotolerans]|uniref:Extracellular solute-binding protein family 1 n=1 Tax=Kineococcus radiotolerans (strain ATCC BAA-149 / DSM 14245 / SRS30216) TaxID=266940 RepID=A6W9Y9_KINRD|nr:extracellular solute-binding protein [Kineococcus radiotolerans]ABS03628.1 extracellular solute-binding protein family 1 [Kineococcus radiotolerans SRS30216 = ATCC BAA-149]